MKHSYKYFTLVALFTAAFLPILPASAYPALYYKYRQLRIGPNNCAGQARITTQSVGLKNISSDRVSSGGTTDTARAFITCITLPKAGPCKGDGATAMFVVASDRSGEDATSLLNQLDSKFGDPVLFDCN